MIRKEELLPRHHWTVFFFFFFKREERIVSSKEPELVPWMLGVSEAAVCPPAPIADDQLYHLPPPLPPPVSNSSCLFSLDASPSIHRCSPGYRMGLSFLSPFHCCEHSAIFEGLEVFAFLRSYPCFRFLFSSRSFICLFWMSVLSSKSQILWWAPSSPGESDNRTLCSSSASAAVTFPLLSSAPPVAFHLIIHQI